MKLSPAAKMAVKAAVQGRGAYKKVQGRGAYMPVPRLLKGRGAYVPDKYSNKDIAQSVAGRAAGYLWDKLFGNGDYAAIPQGIKNNSFMSEITAKGPPQVWATRDNAFVMRHSEYLGDVTTSSSARDFKLDSYAINPGLPQTFPWLSNIANQFQQYEIKGMLFEFRSTCSDAIASGTDISMGSVILATNYNSADDDFASKQQMLQTEFCAQGRPSQCILHPIECKPSLTSVETLYTRSGAVPTGSDIRLYDLGKFQIATQGFQGTSVNIGELWLTYEIAFKKPIQSNGTSVLLGDFYNATTGITSSALYGTNATLVDGSNAGSELSANDILLPDANPGDVYLVTYHANGTAAAINGPVVTATSGHLLQLWDNGANEGGAAPQGGVTSSKVMWSALIKINATFTATPKISASYFSFLTSPTDMQLAVCKVNPNFPLTL